MVKKKKHDKDKWYHLAKEQGYRSRASFKLIQLNRKFDFLSSARAVIDLCAAPGGWLQVAAKYMPVSSVLVGVDLLPIRPIRNVITLKEDIRTQKCKHELKKVLKGWKVEVVLHDGAPNLGQAWAQDAYGQASLTLSALALACDFLLDGGTFVTKVFRSADYNSLLFVFNQLFKKVTVTKPPSSRNTSAEIFVVCQGFLAPKHLDPRFLDPKHVFKELDAPAVTSANAAAKLMMQGSAKKQRNRQGYEEGVRLLYKKASVADFIEGETPIELLAAMNVFLFDQKAEKYEDDRLTTDEIKFCCSDLKVLSKKDIKGLLKWRVKLRSKYVKEEEEESDKEVEEEEDEDAVVDREMNEQLKAAREKKKRQLKKERRLKKKRQHRIDLKMDLVNDVIDTPEDQELFALSQIKNKQQLDAVHDGEEIEEEILESSEEEMVDPDDQFLASDSERVDEMERNLDYQYQQYLEASRRKVPREKIGKKPKKVSEEEDMFAALTAWQAEQMGLKKPNEAVAGDDGGYNSDCESEEEEEPVREKARNPLLIRDESGAPVASSTRAQQWFDQDLFSGLEGPLGGDTMDVDDEEEEEVMAVEAKEEADEMQMDSDDESDVSDGFETVPMMKYKDSSDSESDLDDQERAELLAMGTLVKTGQMKWSDVIDKGFNRYAFNDMDMPKWFEHDENRHNKPQMPVTKEMVDMITAKQKEIDARPAKKVLEAKARKKTKLRRKMEKVKNQASTIANDKDMSDVGKMRALEKLYRNQTTRIKPNSVYVVRSKFQKGRGRVSNAPQVTGNQRIKVVDKRMKSDKRGLKNAAERKKKKRR